jgi:hypothetical protein
VDRLGGLDQQVHMAVLEEYGDSARAYVGKSGVRPVKIIEGHGRTLRTTTDTSG